MGPGGVLSRPRYDARVLLERLFENLALTVEPFAVCQVSDGWRLRMEGLDWVTLHFVLRGEGELRTGASRADRLGPYTLAIVPPDLGHVLQCGTRAGGEATAHAGSTGGSGLPRLVAGPKDRGDLEVVCGRVRAIYGEGLGLFDLLPEPIVLDFFDSEQMRSTFERLLEEQRSAPPAGGAMTTALMNECLVMVFRRLCAQPECPLPWLNALENPRLAPVLETILEHPERAHSLESLSELALMSRSAFAEEFAAAFRRTPMAYVRDVRLRRAAKLLRLTDLPVSAVASRVGFASRSAFSHAFRERFGRTPASFRGAAEPMTAASRT